MANAINNDLKGNITVSGFTADGFRVTLSLEVGTDGRNAALESALETIRESGLVPTPPELPSEKDIATISHVMRREHRDKKSGELVPVIGFYTDNEKLEYKFVHKYMDRVADIDEFEAFAGMKIGQIPMYDGENYPRRTHPKVVKVAQPFRVVRGQRPYHGNDPTIEYVNFLEAYLPAENSAPPAGKSASEPTKPKAASIDRDKLFTSLRGYFLERPDFDMWIAKEWTDNNITKSSTEGDVIKLCHETRPLLDGSDDIPF